MNFVVKNTHDLAWLTSELKSLMFKDFSCKINKDGAISITLNTYKYKMEGDPYDDVYKITINVFGDKQIRLFINDEELIYEDEILKDVNLWDLLLENITIYHTTPNKKNNYSPSGSSLKSIWANI